MIEGELVTSMPLDEDAMKFIEEEFSKMLGGKVRFKTSIDESIIGGFVARINGRVYDGSLLSRLSTMREYITDF